MFLFAPSPVCSPVIQTFLSCQRCTHTGSRNTLKSLEDGKRSLRRMKHQHFAQYGTAERKKKGSKSGNKQPNQDQNSSLGPAAAAAASCFGSHLSLGVNMNGSSSIGIGIDIGSGAGSSSSKRSSDDARSTPSSLDPAAAAAAAAAASTVTGSTSGTGSKFVIKTIDVDNDSGIASLRPQSSLTASSSSAGSSGGAAGRRSPHVRSMSSNLSTADQKEWSEIENLMDLFESVFNSRSPVPLSVWDDSPVQE